MISSHFQPGMAIKINENKESKTKESINRCRLLSQKSGFVQGMILYHIHTRVIFIYIAFSFMCLIFTFSSR